jgi:hypothetical protein
MRGPVLPVWGSLEYETTDMVMNVAGLGPENGCIGEDQQQL